VTRNATLAPAASSTQQSAILAGALVMCVAAGIAVATNRAIYFAAGLVGLASLALGLARWRWSVYGLLLFMPISGIPIILTYPHTQVAVLLKDFIFVVPAYLGFIVARGRQTWSFAGAPALAICGFAGLVIVQCIPQISNPLVALIGVKVWLFYLPMLFLGYHMLTGRSQLVRLLGAMSWAGCVPLVLGIVEAALLARGYSATVYSWYGTAAQSATQDFSDVGSGLGASLRRVPSTFSFVAQYYDFASVMVVVAFGWWRLSGSRLGLIPLTLALLGSFTTGARAAFILTPLLVGLTVILAGRYLQGAAMTLALGLGWAVGLGILGLNANDMVSTAVSVGGGEVSQGFVNGIPMALGLTLTGFGTGQATGASRYALDPSGPTAGVVFSESWWVKTIIELGLAGLVMLVILLGTLVVRAFRSHVSLSDGGLRALSAGFLALLLWALVYAVKGAEIDLDPIDVYFWLFAGMLLRLPGIATSVHGGSSSSVAWQRGVSSPADDEHLEPARLIGTPTTGRSC